MQKKIMLTVK